MTDRNAYALLTGTKINDDDNDNDVYFTLATSDSRIGKYKTVEEQINA